MPNHLADELSPYLLQHAGNPVNWRPWGAEALALAREQQKPIFLSIGYAACHWCHVMAHESFEDHEIARLLNEHFVSIKVDREERLDLDQIYMEAVQMIDRPGRLADVGVPHARVQAVFRRHVLAAAGTRRHGRLRSGPGGRGRRLATPPPGFARTGRADHAVVAGTGRGRIRCRIGRSGTGNWTSPSICSKPKRRCGSRSIRQYGGFGPAPKFPQPLALRWLLGRWRRSGEDALLQMVTTTLDRMAAGGLFDHLGGGFHRYSVDARWLVPHFEKMLYDNASLAVCYLEAWQATGEPRYADVARQTLDYLLRDMTDPLGGLYSSEDADSEGEEGKFYLWTPGEIQAVLGAEAARIFCRVYDVSEAGNFEGRNILHLSRPLETEAKMLGREPTLLAAELAAARPKLLAARATRVRPGRDEKVLVSWNSLAIDALARAGAALDEPRYTAAAGAAADFLLTYLHAARRSIAPLLAPRPGQARRLSRRLCRPGQCPGDAV